MKFTDLKKKLAEGFTANIFLLEGEDGYFREKGIEYLKNKFVLEPQMNFTVIDGGEVLLNVDKFLTTVDMYPFMSEKRMVVVKEFYPKADFFKTHLKTCFDNPVNESIIVIVNSQVSETLKNHPNVTLIDCQKADKSILIKFVTATAIRQGINISPIVAEKICDFCLCDMTKIENETIKLINYAQDKKVITDIDVEKLCFKDVEYQIYELANFVAQKKRDNALQMIKELLSKGETPTRLLSSLYTHFRRLLFVAISTETNKELAVSLGVKEFAIAKQKEQAKCFKKKSLKLAVDTIADYDYKTKSGKTDAEDALNNVVFKLMAL